MLPCSLLQLLTWHIARQVRISSWVESYSKERRKRQPLFVASFMKCVLPKAVSVIAGSADDKKFNPDEVCCALLASAVARVELDRALHRVAATTRAHHEAVGCFVRAPPNLVAVGCPRLCCAFVCQRSPP